MGRRATHSPETNRMLTRPKGKTYLYLGVPSPLGRIMARPVLTVSFKVVVTS
jgi:hypothetical protein